MSLWNGSKVSVMGGTHAATEEQLDILASWTSDNLTVVMQLDPSIRSSRRVRGPEADFYELMAALDKQTVDLPDTHVLSSGRRVPVYASPPVKPAGMYGADGPNTPVDPLLNETVDRFLNFYNFTGLLSHFQLRQFLSPSFSICFLPSVTGKAEGQVALGQQCRDCPAFDNMLNTLCWPGK